MDKCYYGYLKNPLELQKASSGGFAASIAKYAIQVKGVVYGVAYTPDYKEAEFIRVTTESDIQRLLGSKYIYANSSAIRGAIFDDIESGKLVICIGLPCNIAGLLAAVRNKGIVADNLITVDLVCGGATLPEVGRQYIEYLEAKHKSDVVDFSVRYKNPDWVPPYLRAVFRNGKVYCKEFYETEYGYAFEHMKRDACYVCTFKGDRHFSDITIGDCWGIQSNELGYNAKGVSVAFVHSEAGETLLKALTDIVLYETNADRMKRSNPRYLTPKPRLPNNEQFRKDFEQFGLHKACIRAYGIKKRLISTMPDGLVRCLRTLKHKMENKKT